MSADDFLTRWSRRKRAAEESAAAPEPSPSDPSPAPPARPAEDATSAEAGFDLASLPTIESINAATDITVFLRKGVPPDLARAALRRAWTADPTIRDFVGLAENAWDFNDPNAMPGFGPLDYSAEQVRDLVAQVMGETRPAPDEIADTPVASLPESAGDSSDGVSSDTAELPQISAQDGPENGAVPATAERSASEGTDESAVATQRESDRFVRRIHGGALPR